MDIYSTRDFVAVDIQQSAEGVEIGLLWLDRYPPPSIDIAPLGQFAIPAAVLNKKSSTLIIQAKLCATL
jgi:hypothetical protein